MLGRLVRIAIIAVTGLPCLAQNDVIEMGRERRVESRILGEPVTYKIHVPRTYDTSPNRRYPVLYLLQGDYQFAPAVGNVSFMSAFVEVPEMIIVGINSGNQSLNYTPSTEVGREDQTGGAESYLAFLTEELVPLVDRNYRTAEFRVLVGHSISGLFAYYAMLESPEAFNAYVAISPSLWWDNEILVRRSSKELPGIKAKLSLYLNLANEPDEMEQAFKNSTHQLKELAPPNLRWVSETLPEETHHSTPMLSTVRALRWIFTGWNATPNLVVKSMAELDDHYRQLSDRLGFQIQLTEDQYNLYGLKAARDGKPAWGVEILQRAVSEFPTSAVLLDSLAEAHELNGEPQKALSPLKKAVALSARSNSHAYFSQHLKRLQASLDEQSESSERERTGSQPTR